MTCEFNVLSTDCEEEEDLSVQIACTYLKEQMTCSKKYINNGCIHTRVECQVYHVHVLRNLNRPVHMHYR